MRRHSFILMVFMLAGCTFADFLPPTSANIHITTDTLDGVIFTAENAAEAGLQYEFNDPILEYWTPTTDQALALEMGLTSFLQTASTSEQNRAQLLENLAAYRRQYFGIAFKGGERLIYASYFCDDRFDQWLVAYIAVDDGGACFFQVVYNPAANLFSNLRVNGSA